MDTGLLALIVFLICVILGLCTKMFFLRRAAGEIETGLSERLMTDTNTLIDISSRDRRMKRLAESINVQLRRLRKERHRFIQGDVELKKAVANISHDLRTPLTAISSYLELLDKEEKSDNVNRYIEVIKNRTEALKQLTEELFRYSVITSPEFDSTTEPLSVNQILEEAILDYYAALQVRSITPNIHMTEKRIIRTLNRGALSRVFANLINNAIKYSDGDLDITLTGNGKIIFSNRASGLNRIQVERLFDRFYTVENAGKSTGLGLSIARVLVEQMHGTISARFENERLDISIQLPE